FIERELLRPPPSVGRGVVECAARLQLDDRSLEREGEQTTQSFALNVEPGAKTFRSDILAPNEKVAHPEIYCLAIASLARRISEFADVVCDVTRRAAHGTRGHLARGG